MIRPALAALALQAPVAAAEALPGNWSLETGQDPETLEHVVVLSVESAAEIPDEYARKKVRPALAFTCVPGAVDKLSVRVDWRRFISSFNTEISFKADSRELLLVNWGVDKSNRITKPRSSGDGRELIDYLKGASALLVEVIPYSDSLVTVQYDISGIDAALQALADECD